MISTIAQRAVGMALAVGIALVAGGPARAQGPRQAGQAQRPTLACSISVPRDANDASLAQRAKITLAQATQTAQAASPGEVLRAGLDNENGCLVYSVEIRSADAKIHDVKVDAGTAAVLHQQTGLRLEPEHEGSGERENGPED
ncbi:MAG TPA: PepSY domain-containing protein [bacterium]|nr:PepSY domain-containing protein [bacterium]